MKKIVEQRKDIAFYIKLFPLAMHPGAKEKAQTIACEHSLALLEQSFDGKPLPKPDCQAPEIDKNIELGRALGIDGTPALILPNGVMVVGVLPPDELITRIDHAAKKPQKTEAPKPARVSSDQNQ
ncbi:MAG: thioredoxin fold domain-containing protein, partial [Nitrospiraceae bacterium]|nr:thioredoxin fold domain-containing protein [Nitrospiraceae bacterium]